MDRAIHYSTNDKWPEGCKPHGRLRRNAGGYQGYHHTLVAVTMLQWALCVWKALPLLSGGVCRDSLPTPIQWYIQRAPELRIERLEEWRRRCTPHVLTWRPTFEVDNLKISPDLQQRVEKPFSLALPASRGNRRQRPVYI